MEVIIKEGYDDISHEAAAIIAKLVRRKPKCVLGLATGGTPLGLYRELARMHKEEGLDFSQVTTFNLDEYVGLEPTHPQSYAFYMEDNFFKHVNVPPKQRHIPNGSAHDIPAHCEQYEKEINAAGGIDLQVLGLGADGHIGFNEPSSSLSSATRIKTLTQETIKANSRYFNGEKDVPRHVITMGVGTIFRSRHCLILASGSSKATAVSDTVEGPITAMVPASALQLHAKCTVLVDKEASSKLKLKDYYVWTYQNKPEWQRAQS